MYDDFEIEDYAPWLALLITLIGGALRVYLLNAKGMWLDETFSVWLANQGAGEMLQWIVKIDQHPPLYYLLLHAWIALRGDTPQAVRMLSVIFGTATIPVIYLIGKRMSGAAVGLAAAVFLAFSPFNIYFAQEARMYTLLTFNAAVAMYALVWLLTDARSASPGGAPIGAQLREYVKAWRTGAPVAPKPEQGFRYQVEPPQSGWRGWIYRHRLPPIRAMETDLAWAALIVFTAAALLTHNTAILFLAAINIYVFGLLFYQKRSKKRPAFQAPSLTNWIKAQVGILLLWSPWIVIFVRQAAKVDQQFWIPKPTWEIILQTLRSLLNASAPGSSIQRIIVGIMGGVLCLGLVYYRKKLSIFFFLAALFFVPFLGELIVSIRRPIFYGRTLIWITIPLLLLLAAGIAQLKFRLLKIVVLGVIAANYLFSTTDYFRWFQKEDWYSAAGYVALFAEPGDLVLFNSNFVVIPFNYYFGAYENQYSIQVEKRGIPLDLFADGILEPKMTADDIPGLISLVSQHDRVWLVYSHDSYTDPEGLIPQTLEAEMELMRTREFYGGKVQLFANP